MKKSIIYISLVAVLTAGGFSSCSLDKEVDLSMSGEELFTDFTRTQGALATLYTYLPDAFAGYTDGQFLGASRDCMTDNCTSFWDVHRYHSIQNGSYNATNHWFASTYWNNDLAGIRRCNQFLTKTQVSVVGNETKTGDDNRLYDRYIDEARFIRALLHFDMITWFGAIPIETAPLTNETAVSMTRTPAPEALKWVIEECDAIIKDGALPFRYANENENWGRVNGAAVYALKSRASLYLASPLNDPSNDIALWKQAADAALAFMTENNKLGDRAYRLYTTENNDPNQNYYQCFVSTPHLNNEFILSRSEWNTQAIEQFNSPCGFQGQLIADGRNNPFENFVECYEMKNGKFVDEEGSGYDPKDPYANRDPRLEQTILHQGSTWGDPQQDEERKVDVTNGSGQDYATLHGGTSTGYYVKKFVHNISFKSPSNTLHACPIFRYAEILLNAAEALNEAGETNQAYQYVNQVRARVGMPPYKGLTQDELRERIQNERRIELAFEDHRFADERRWKLFDKQTAQSELRLPIRKQIYHLYSMQVDGTSDDLTNRTYTVVPNSKHATYAFQSPRDYLFPIPDSEVKSAPGLGQNPGWELSTNSSSESEPKDK